KSSLCLGKDVDSTGACSRLSVRNRQLITNLPRVHKLAAFQRKLARCEKQRTALRKRNVVCGGCCGLRDRYTQIFEAAVDRVGHCINPCLQRYFAIYL